MTTQFQSGSEDQLRYMLVPTYLRLSGLEFQISLQILLGPGKRNNQQVGTTALAGKDKRRSLFYIMDRNNKLKFLVDTGAAISVIPFTNEPSAKPTLLKLQVANGYTIDTYGSKSPNGYNINKSLTLDIGMTCDNT